MNYLETVKKICSLKISDAHQVSCPAFLTGMYLTSNLGEVPKLESSKRVG
jgi:hypothetical protein